MGEKMFMSFDMETKELFRLAFCGVVGFDA